MVDVFGHNLHLKICPKFSILPKTMPNAFSQPIDIDQEWAQSLVSLRMKVPDHWWHGCSGSELYDGTIAAVNFDDHGDRCFQLEIDQENNALYPMRYDAVLHYADEENSQFSSFHLPANPPSNPANKSIRVRRRPCRIFNNDNDKSDDECANASNDKTAPSSDEEEDDGSEEEDCEIYRLTAK